jgi:solute carrier family 35 protein F5
MHARSPSSDRAIDSRSAAASSSGGNIRERLGLAGVARRTLGIALLLVVVFLWTLSNFLASVRVNPPRRKGRDGGEEKGGKQTADLKRCFFVQYIFSDGTYNKPFFLVYVNTSCFAVSLIPITIRYAMQNGTGSLVAGALSMWRGRWFGLVPLNTRDDEGDEGSRDEDAAAGERLLVDDEGSLEAPRREEKLGLAETARLSLEFSMLWFAANYFASACLEYTSVGSVTILTSTSSIWTLIFCALTRVESFTVRKLIGVLASLTGVILISSVDLSGANDDNRGSFPHKSTAQIAIGDAMAFFSAIIYGVYVTVMKRRVGNEDRVNMPLFFGLVGLFNVLLLWPGFFILHFTGIEPVSFSPFQHTYGSCACLLTQPCSSNCRRQVGSGRSSR